MQYVCIVYTQYSHYRSLDLFFSIIIYAFIFHVVFTVYQLEYANVFWFGCVDFFFPFFFVNGRRYFAKKSQIYVRIIIIYMNVCLFPIDLIADYTQVKDTIKFIYYTIFSYKLLFAFDRLDSDDSMGMKMLNE